MKKTLCAIALAVTALTATAQSYTPAPENLAARENFRKAKLGIFLHWGIYSTFAQGEWYLQNYVPDRMEYAKAADAFYPASGSRPSRTPEPNTSASPHATTTVSRCGTPGRATTIS